MPEHLRYIKKKMTMIIRQPDEILNCNNTYVKGYEPDRAHAMYKAVMQPYYLERHGLLMEAIVCLVKGVDETLVAQCSDIMSTRFTQSEKKKLGGAGTTNLISERHFGYLDASQKKRPSATLHYHSTVLLLTANRKRLMNWLKAMSFKERKQVMDNAKRNGKLLRAKHRRQELIEKQKEVKNLDEMQKSISQKAARKLLKNAKGYVHKKKSNSRRKHVHIKITKPTVNYRKIVENDWVAVAYEDGYFIGNATSVKNDMVTVDFLASATTEHMYKRPAKPEVVGVQQKFIFIKIDGTNVVPVCGGRFLKLTNASDVKQKYDQFKQYYF